MLGDKAYTPYLKEMGFFDIQLTDYNIMMLELYNKIINPQDQSIDWIAYFKFCELENYPNIKENQDLILHIRETLSNFRDKKDSKSKETNVLSKEEQEENKIKRVRYKDKKKDNKDGTKS